MFYFFDTKYGSVVEVESHRRLGFDGHIHIVTYSRAIAVRGERVERPWCAGFVHEPSRYVFACSKKLHAHGSCKCGD